MKCQEYGKVDALKILQDPYSVFQKEQTDAMAEDQLTKFLRRDFSDQGAACKLCRALQQQFLQVIAYTGADLLVMQMMLSHPCSCNTSPIPPSLTPVKTHWCTKLDFGIIITWSIMGSISRMNRLLYILILSRKSVTQHLTRYCSIWN